MPKVSLKKRYKIYDDGSKNKKKKPMAELCSGKSGVRPSAAVKQVRIDKSKSVFVDFPIVVDPFRCLESEPLYCYDRVKDEYFEADPYRKRRGKYSLGFVKCCPKWHDATTKKITSLLRQNGIKSKKQISRAIDVVMFILRAQTVVKCQDTEWTYKNKVNDQWVNLSYDWFAFDFFHSKTAAVKILRILRDNRVLLTDHSWIHIPETKEARERAGWSWDTKKKGYDPENRPQGWLVNYKPKTLPADWADYKIDFDLNEQLEMVRKAASEVGEIDTGVDDVPLVIDIPAVESCILDGELSPAQALRDIALCKKYARQETWKNPPLKLNKDGTPKAKQRRPTDRREYSPASMVSKPFLHKCMTGRRGSEYDGGRVVEVCDLHTGVIPSLTLAEIIRIRETGARVSGGEISSIPTYKELKPVFDILEHLQARRVKTLPDGTLVVTRDGDVYMDAVREIERRVSSDTIAARYLGEFFAGCETEDDKRDLVKPYLLMSSYIDAETREKRRCVTLRPPKNVSKHSKGRRLQRVIDAMVCTFFFEMLQREYPVFADIISKTYVTKPQKTEQYDQMSRGEEILIHAVSKHLKKRYGIRCFRKHDALLMLRSVDPTDHRADELFDEKIGKAVRERVVWEAASEIMHRFERLRGERSRRSVPPISFTAYPPA